MICIKPVTSQLRFLFLSRFGSKRFKKGID